jgi:hypothetical protein
MVKECGAKAKTAGHRACRQYALPNGRCRFHGGMSTGARTAEGLRRIKEANTKHGLYSAEAIAERKVCRELIKASRFHISRGF